MQHFRTIIDIEKTDIQINHAHNILFIGSCFTENIGNIFDSFFFKTDINPFGIVYNPISVRNGIDILLKQKKFCEEDIFYYNNLYQSFDHHSKFSHHEKATCLNIINERILHARDFLLKTDIIFITFGTALVYKLKNTGQTVSNCHKLSANKFDKIMLNVDEILENYVVIIDELNKLRPNLKIVFTISPIRHISDGAVTNQISKSVLFVAINEIMKLYKNISYFPSYEIMMDELRDYRFYEQDMIHISKLAIMYIWSRFQEAYFDRKTMNLLEEIGHFIKASEHRPFDRTSPKWEEFLRNYITKISNFMLNNQINLSRLMKHFEEQMTEVYFCKDKKNEL